ncbi:hypothetical protein [Azohydromonas lata]|uniref:hypothetical protein n=1 Tax=Azohydromonas lata TaxID=45677 RepID=UPI0012F4A579|nr:hypothetical protein [Azohydromonas lata]
MTAGRAIAVTKYLYTVQNMAIFDFGPAMKACARNRRASHSVRFLDSTFCANTDRHPTKKCAFRRDGMQTWLLSRRNKKAGISFMPKRNGKSTGRAVVALALLVYAAAGIVSAYLPDSQMHWLVAIAGTALVIAAAVSILAQLGNSFR